MKTTVVETSKLTPKSARVETVGPWHFYEIHRSSYDKVIVCLSITYTQFITKLGSGNGPG